MVLPAADVVMYTVGYMVYVCVWCDFTARYSFFFGPFFSLFSRFSPLWYHFDFDIAVCIQSWRTTRKNNIKKKAEEEEEEEKTESFIYQLPIQWDDGRMSKRESRYIHKTIRGVKNMRPAVREREGVLLVLS